jgi:hypothetical protein
MAWADVPVVAGTDILKAAFDEARAAIVERCLAAGIGYGTLQTAAGNGDQPWALIANYRGFVDGLIQYFCNPATGVNYAKVALLTALIGAADWVANPDAVPRRMFIRELNELRTVLNALLWRGLPITIASGDTYWSWPGGGSSDVSWAAAWADAQAAYAGAMPGAASLVDFETAAFSPSPPDGKQYYKSIQRSLLTDLSVAIPNFDVADTKMQVAKLGVGDNFNFDLHEQAAFGGAAISVAVGAAQNATVLEDVTTVVKNTTAHYSCRTNPAAPNPLAYAPADANGATRGARMTFLKLLVQFAFTYT